MKKLVFKIIMCCVSLHRTIRSKISTSVLRLKAKKCGPFCGAARLPHIGSQVELEVGHHCGFNGFTATGWGG